MMSNSMAPSSITSTAMTSGPLVVIPARYDSTRFPGKPLADLCGRPMIQHVWERAVAAKRPGRVVVATDDLRIAECVRAFGGECVMTAAGHRNGTERVAEVAATSSSPLVVNLQGDLPLFHPPTLDRLIDIAQTAVTTRGIDGVTARAKIDLRDEIFSPSCVKVVVDREDRALYFSRATIPHADPSSPVPPETIFYKHFGIYIYQRDFLLRLAQMPEGRLEATERLEQLRVLEAGGRILAVTLSPVETDCFFEVNHPEDLRRVEAYLADMEGNRTAVSRSKCNKAEFIGPGGFEVKGAGGEKQFCGALRPNG